MHLHKDMDMQISFNATPASSSPSGLTLEVTPGYLWGKIGNREVFVKWRSGLPLREFARERTGTDTQLWGFGTYAVISR